MSKLNTLTELRRALPLAAAALLLVAIALPMWRITLEAPQYPDGLFVELYAYPRLEGDVAETQALNQYVGFYYPDPVYLDPNYDVNPNAISVPEWSVGPIAFVAVAAAGVFVALAPTVRKLKLGLTCQLAGTFAVFVTMFAAIQYRLYQTGHSLDPDAPMRGIDGFTPPLLGSYEIANISGVAWFGPGGYLTIVALALLVVAFLSRDSDATLGDVPALVRDRTDRLIGRIRPERDSSDGSDPKPTTMSTDATAADREVSRDD
ncbi:hypothetical protein G6M89_05040 [Natronolimnobius sp. AArcel1]|uniref:hypothetical protein n=1 Tax=Natronolimnobius sp. AArcel1 TaxID=1679093 RepID=UPI0013EC944A|nr:hypothetical protein [Natronolimnobius sp. AArcel1]NGM68377.1 hypothetical protein [Natronolimnobius sp. AArcel1]